MRHEGRPRPRLVRTLAVVLWVAILGAGAFWAIGVAGEFIATARTTPRYDPPVLSGQMVTGGCSGGVYARDGRTIVITISAHCGSPGGRLEDAEGLIGVLGPRAQLLDCPEGRFCAPSDILTLALARERIPWGHLDLIDMGAGGYRQLAPGTMALACADIQVGERVEIDGRERYRTGTVVEIGPYEHETDTIFPCMAVADIDVGTGDSGGIVLVDAQPAGVVARELGRYMGFTPLAEGLENLGLTLCTTPDCDLSPDVAEQPTG